MAKDWEAVAAAIRARLEELDMTQAELAHRAGVAPETVRELRNNLQPRRRQPRTLAAVSEALNWPPEYLTSVLRGAQLDSPVGADELGAIHDELTSIAGRLTDIAGRLTRIRR